jgi:5-methylcytosine-specific restriction endonuclease McrA
MPKGVYQHKPLSEKHKRKIGEALKGREHIEETKKKISEANKIALKGHLAWNKRLKFIHSGSFKKGHPCYLTEESKKKISEKLKGRKRSAEFKANLSLLRMGKGNPMYGKKSHNWQGGITPLLQQIRHYFKYRQWRSDVFTRDDFTCVLCGKRGGWIEADHYPKSFSNIFKENKITSLEQASNCEEFWNINNGRTLCLGCHNKTKKQIKCQF